MIIETLEEINSSISRNDRIPEIRQEVDNLNEIILKGFKDIKAYFDKKWQDIAEENSQIYELENHRLKANSGEGNSNDQEK
mmetsp:Transcript_20660/g.18304  ORF Transcript_20660/g.18304 Transcript_20660/m.18304 type:complete len:81 (-) Transcript_20660:167-409(-)